MGSCNVIYFRPFKLSFRASCQLLPKFLCSHQRLRGNFLCFSCNDGRTRFCSTNQIHVNIVVIVSFTADKAIILALKRVLTKFISIVGLFQILQNLLADLLLLDLHILSYVFSDGHSLEVIELHIFLELLGVDVIVSEEILFFHLFHLLS